MAGEDDLAAVRRELRAVTERLDRIDQRTGRLADATGRAYDEARKSRTDLDQFKAEQSHLIPSIERSVQFAMQAATAPLVDRVERAERTHELSARSIQELNDRVRANEHAHKEREKRRDEAEAKRDAKRRQQFFWIIVNILVAIGGNFAQAWATAAMREASTQPARIEAK